MEFVGQAEGGHGDPDTAGTDCLSILGKGSVKHLGKGQHTEGGAAVAGKNTKGGGVGSDRGRLEGFEGELKPPVGGVAEAASRLEKSIGGRVGSLGFEARWGPVWLMRCVDWWLGRQGWCRLRAGLWESTGTRGLLGRRRK